MLIYLLNTFQDILIKTGLIFISGEQFLATIFSYYFSKLPDLFEAVEFQYLLVVLI